MTINNVNYTKLDIVQQETYARKGKNEFHQKTTSVSAETTNASAVYETSDEQEVLTDTGYKVDMDKVLAMKEEADQRMVDLFRETVKSGALKQIHGLKNFVSYVEGLSGESLEKTNGLANIMASLTETEEVAEESVSQADTKEIDAYWSAEAVSDRFLDFAKALSGGDTSKGKMLLEAVKEGYKQAEEIWGSELPELSQKTLEMTIKKFEDWYGADDTEDIQ